MRYAWCLIKFKRLYDTNAPLDIALKSVAPHYAGRQMGLRDLCTAIHVCYRANNTADCQRVRYSLVAPFV
ncbi:hypothetical protein [Microseira sp. BLCC-F43]|uniref:hypothetical protein n=1 Tax=Microseira sp. BLCC-F43 TaxID=3153602 RepID=UPI0035BC4FC7